MLKIGEFIYPWGSGHYSRMMRFNAALAEFIRGEVEIHYSSKGHVYQKLLRKFPGKAGQIHNILMPTPIDGRMGPSVGLSVLNVLLPVGQNPPLVRQIADYLRQERRLYDEKKFDLAVSDGDVGTNILARNRGIPSLFITNQFMPRLYRTRSYFYPCMAFVARQMAKATHILVADSPPPYTMCEYNLNFTGSVAEKVSYVGHFTAAKKPAAEPTDLERLIRNAEFGYWMRTGNDSTNHGTGQRYEEVFARDEMRREKRIISHARDDPGIDSVLAADGRRHSINEALEKKIDWIQIDVGYLTEQEKETVLECCRYAVVNGSHTVMGEILGGKSKPIIGMPVYDEHTNNIRWAQERNLGILAKSPKRAAEAVAEIREDRARFEEGLQDFAANFVPDGAANAARIAAGILEKN